MAYAFERYCRKNHRLIANILGFSAVQYKHGAFFNRSTSVEDPGFQIDLVFERADKTVCICEIKYTESQANVSVGREFAKKLALFPMKNNYQYQRVLISANGASQELSAGGVFDRIISVGDFV